MAAGSPVYLLPSPSFHFLVRAMPSLGSKLIGATSRIRRKIQTETLLEIRTPPSSLYGGCPAGHNPSAASKAAATFKLTHYQWAASQVGCPLLCSHTKRSCARLANFS